MTNADWEGGVYKERLVPLPDSDEDGGNGNEEEVDDEGRLVLLLLFED